MSTVRLHNLVTHTTALGPGTRMVIWFQGCRRRCPGCMSPETWDMQGGVLRDTAALAQEYQRSGCEGQVHEKFLHLFSSLSLPVILKRSSTAAVISTNKLHETAFA